MALSALSPAAASRPHSVASATREVLADLLPGEVLPLAYLVERVSVALDGAAVSRATVLRAARQAAAAGVCGKHDYHGELTYCQPASALAR
ncbi:MAG: hypothetical protein KY475_27110 [Planctomycetes bacterium]|nr:hypothetical protein [Planctomycetota bacterium]